MMAGLTIDNPVMLFKALTSSHVIPGDTLRLLPGTYTSDFGSQIAGTTGSPITITALYPGTVKIDGSFTPIQGGNLILDGLEVTCTRWPTRVYDTAQEANYTNAVNVGGVTGIKMRNCIVHNGIDNVWSSGGLIEMYGCLLLNGGYSRGGHDIYTHNNVGTYNLFENNIFLASYNYGFHAHSSGNNYVKNYHLKNNIFGKCNFKHTFGNDNNLDYAVQDILFENNENLDTYWWFNRWSNRAKNIIVRNNYFTGYEANTADSNTGCCSFKVFDDVQCYGNTFYNPDGGLLVRVKWGDTPVYDFHNNTYYGSGSFMGQGDIVMDYASWCTEIGETGSTYTVSVPPNRVRVIPNIYDPTRCHVAVYNYSLANSVTVDVSGVYQPDEVIKVHQTQDYFNDIQTLTVSPSGTISIDMRAEVHTVELPVGAAEAIDPKMCPMYGAFILQKV